MRVVMEVGHQDLPLATIRRLVETWADAHHVDRADLALAATELVSNALAASPPGSSVVLRLEAIDDTARVVVVDEGPGFELGGLEQPGLGSRRGRGLPLVAASVDALEVERVDGLTVVTAAKRAVADPAPAGA